MSMAARAVNSRAVSSISLLEIGLGMLVSRLAYYNDGAFARTTLSRSGASPHAQYAARSPPPPSATNAQPHVAGDGPGAFVRSRIRPNTIGATAPAPKPRNERSARAAPRWDAPTASVSAVDSTGESPSAVNP